MTLVRRRLSLGAPFFAAFGAFLFIYALTLQDGPGLDAAGSGITITPMAVAFLIASLVSSRLTARFGQRWASGTRFVGVLVVQVLVAVVIAVAGRKLPDPRT